MGWKTKVAGPEGEEVEADEESLVAEAEDEEGSLEEAMEEEKRSAKERKEGRTRGQLPMDQEQEEEERTVLL